MSDTTAPTVVTITPRDNGAYRVAGPFVILDAEGGRWAIPEGKTVILCRCGHSGDKPFCDGSHRGAGFESIVRAPAAE